ncbi:hypothetical protein C8F01DRAFT_1370954 [Mycena amicta]|nr:hypothetical protein C8F01DRAFT_1370954 [Mycena amicta]
MAHRTEAFPDTTRKPGNVREKIIVRLMEKPWREFTSVEQALWDKLGDEHQRSKRPNKHKNTAAWNAHFERQITFKYRPWVESGRGYPSMPENSDGAQKIMRRHLEDLAHINEDLARMSRELMTAEGSLVLHAVDCLIDRGFEGEWAALGPERKAEFVLEGLYRGACQAPRDNSRELCPEMTIAGLTGDGQFGLIAMLKAIMSHDPTGNGRISSLYLFKHPCTDSELRLSDTAPDTLKALWRRRILLRNMYIVQTLEGTLQAWMGYPRESVQRVNRSSPILTEQQRQKTRDTRNDMKNGVFYVDESQCKEEKKIVRNVCNKCIQTMERTDLKRCKKCQNVWYCSKECQRRDWDQHKRTCGLHRFDLDAVEPKPDAPAQFIGCPTAEPNFIRSPALWRQIWYLSKDDSQRSDYHYDKTPGNTGSFSFFPVSPELHLVFLVARRRAMATGSRVAVAQMLSLIHHPLMDEFYDLPVDKMREQLAREYRIPPFASWAEVKKVAGDFERLTESEMKEELEFLSLRFQKADQLHKNMKNVAKE